MKVLIPCKGHTGLRFIKDETVLQTLLDPRSFVPEEKQQPMDLDEPREEMNVDDDGAEDDPATIEELEPSREMDLDKDEAEDKVAEDDGENMDVDEEDEGKRIVVEKKDENEQQQPMGVDEEEKPNDSGMQTFLTTFPSFCKT